MWLSSLVYTASSPQLLKRCVILANFELHDENRRSDKALRQQRARTHRGGRHLRRKRIESCAQPTRIGTFSNTVGGIWHLQKLRVNMNTTGIDNVIIQYALNDKPDVGDPDKKGTPSHHMSHQKQSDSDDKHQYYENDWRDCGFPDPYLEGLLLINSTGQYVLRDPDRRTKPQLFHFKLRDKRKNFEKLVFSIQSL